MDCVRFLESIAQALQKFVPEGVRLTANAGQILVTTLDDTTSIQVCGEFSSPDDWSSEPKLSNAMYALLEQLQEILTRHLRSPWPASGGVSPSLFAPPYVEIHPSRVLLAYATPDMTALEVSIPITRS